MKEKKCIPSTFEIFLGLPSMDSFQMSSDDGEQLFSSFR